MHAGEKAARAKVARLAEWTSNQYIASKEQGTLRENQRISTLREGKERGEKETGSRRRTGGQSRW